jgi:hypothetical protein
MKEYRLKIFENRVFRRIFGPKRDEVAAGWRKLHNEELHNLHSSLNVIRIIKIKEHKICRACSTHGKKWNAYIILVGTPA